MIYKLAQLFTDKEKVRAMVIFFFVAIGAGLEVVSLATLAALISLFLDGDPEVYKWIVEVKLLNVSNKLELIQILGIVVVVLFLLKNIYLLMVNYILHKFIYNKYTKISTQLLKSYIEMPYINHLQTNSSFLQRNINTEVFWVFANIMIPGVTLLTELVIVISIVIALMYVDLVNTLIFGFSFGLVLSLTMILIKKKMDALGLISQNYFGEMIKSVNQSLGGIKLTKVSNSTKYFVDVFQSNVNRYSNNTSNLKNISQWPRYFIEVIVVFGIVIATIATTYGNLDSDISLVQLSFFGFAAVRLMPSFNRITSSYTNIRYYSASLDVVCNELDNSSNIKQHSDKKQDSCITFDKDIEFKDVSFIYPETIKHSINNISFKIKKGESIALIGGSGSGKTTIVDLICGLLEPSDGVIMADGKNIFDNLHEWRKMISYVPQNIYLLDDSLRNNIAYGINTEDIDDNLIARVSKLAMLGDYINGLEFGYETMIGENGVKMSGGQRQRLGIARALYNNPKILILDEGTAALDNKSQEYVINSINAIASEITVITIAHRLDTVKNSDLILLIEKGSVKREVSKNMLREFDMNLSQLIDYK
ncbi:ABC transporter ATP-binding protein [bacterium]|jgi:ATP-binding cassette, subfamily B, bacterial PglK|nr:ABC transporter ATP-binding protein [bacterium]